MTFTDFLSLIHAIADILAAIAFFVEFRHRRRR
jgi:hypothetical protein